MLLTGLLEPFATALLLSRAIFGRFVPQFASASLPAPREFFAAWRQSAQAWLANKMNMETRTMRMAGTPV